MISHLLPVQSIKLREVSLPTVITGNLIIHQKEKIEFYLSQGLKKLIQPISKILILILKDHHHLKVQIKTQEKRLNQYFRNLI